MGFWSLIIYLLNNFFINLFWCHIGQTSIDFVCEGILQFRLLCDTSLKNEVRKNLYGIDWHCLRIWHIDYIQV